VENLASNGIRALDRQPVANRYTNYAALAHIHMCKDYIFAGGRQVHTDIPDKNSSSESATVL
jgi:hypothetical protein